MKLFITGATGFVGSVLIPDLLRLENLKSIKVLKLSHEQKPEYLKNSKIEVFDSDILNKDDLIREIKGYTHVIHLAALISYKKDDYEKLYKVNCRGVQNIIEACKKNNVQRLIHISSVGAIGYLPKGELADENTPFNWPEYFHYMTTKYEGQKVVLEAIKESNLDAVILNPASIMGPGDCNIKTPHSQLYDRLYNKKIVGSFSGGLAVVDVRDLVAIIVKSLSKSTFKHPSYLVVGHNITYQDLLKLMGTVSKKKVYPFKVPGILITFVGILNEFFAKIFKSQPLLTYSYGKISGMYGYYSNQRSREEYSHNYYPLEETIQESCNFFQNNFLK